jgi:hypothetical protein
MEWNINVLIKLLVGPTSYPNRLSLCYKSNSASKREL